MIVNLPKLGPVEFPDNLSSEQYDSLVSRLAEKYDFKIPKPEASLGTIAKRGFMRSMGELGIAAGDVLPSMVGGALGFEDYAKKQLEEAAASRAKLEEKYPTRYKSYTEVTSPFEALEYAAETAGELLPSVGASLVPGVGGGVLGGRLAAQAATRAAGAGAGRAALAAPIVEKAAEVGARRGMYGGVFLGSYAQNTPEIFESIYQETGNLESGIAALTGGLSAALDSVLPAKILNTLGGYGKLKLVEDLAKRSGAAPAAWKTIGKEAATAAASEGLTESAQEAIKVYAQKLAGSTQDLLSPDNIQQYKEAFVKGALGGGMFGVPGGVAKYARERAEFQRGEAAPEAAPEIPPEVPPTEGAPALPAPEEQLRLGMEPSKLPAPEAEPPVQAPVDETSVPTITPGALEQIQSVSPAEAPVEGAPDVTRPIEPPSGAGVGVVSQPDTGAAAPGVGAPQPDGVVPAAADVGQPVVGEGAQPSAIVAPAAPEVTAPEAVAPAAPEVSVPSVPTPEAPEVAAPAVPRETRKAKRTAPPKTDADVSKIQSLDKPKLTPEERDARAYLGRADTETALRNIANDLVLQPTAYRNAKMTLPSVSKPGTFAQEPEPTFKSESEAAVFRGQGGVHAKNAAQWVRNNLNPEQVAYMDNWIAQYTKEKERSTKFRKKLETQQQVKAATKARVAETAVEADTAEQDALADLKEDRRAFGIKAKAKDRRAARKLAERVVRDMQDADLDVDVSRIADSDLDSFLASPEVAATSTSVHPTVEAALRGGNFARALGLFADSSGHPRLTRVVETLANVLQDVKVVYGAERAMFDPKTNTVYLPEDATDYELLHEATHAGLSHVIANPSHPVTRQLDKLFQQVKADIDGAYGAKNLQEFVAEVWSNDNLRNLLKEKRSEVPSMSMWDKLIRLIRRALRLPERTEPTLDQIDRLLDSVVGPPPDFRAGDSLFAQSIHDPGLFQKILNQTSDLTQKHTKMTPEQASRFIASMETAGLSLRQGMQKFLNLSAMAEVGARILGRDAITFADTINQMAGYRENMIEKLSPLDKRLQMFSTKPEFAKWTKMVHDHTREDINPEAPASKYANTEKVAMHAQFAKEFNAAFPEGSEGRKLYRDLFSSYKKLFKELKDSLYSNLVEVHEEGTPERKQALGAYEKVIDMITAKGIDHYAPLYRQGRFWLQYKDKDGREFRQLYDTQVERTAARNRLEREGNTDFDEYMKDEGGATRTAPSGTVAAQIIKIMKEGGAEDAAVDKFLELLVSAMPETSILKSFNARKGTLGYEENAATAFRNVTSNMVSQLARMRYSDKLQSLLGEMNKTAQGLRGINSVRGAEIVREFEDRYQFAMKPSIEAWARWASSGAFYYNLAGNISSATINLLQTPMVVLPQLGGTYGFTDAARALWRAAGMYSSSGFSRMVTDINGQQVKENAMLSVENLVNSGKAPQYKALVQRLKELGFLQTSTARDALEVSNAPTADAGAFRTTAEKAALYSSFLFHHAERMNREVTAVAAYDLEMARLQKAGVTGEAAQAQAIDKAIRMVEYTHGAGHAESAPSIGHSSLGKVLTVFKRFAFTMYYMLFDTIRRSLPVPADATPEQKEMVKAARRQLVGIYGMSAIFAGAKGVPLYWIAETAYNAFADDDDDQFDEVMRRYLGEFWFKGPVNYLTNLGIADRVGWTDLIYRDQKGDKADADVLSQFIENILGAPYSMVNNVLRGQELVAEGQFWRGVETMLPVALKNPLKAYRYATEGATTIRGDLVGEVNGANAAMQVLGFAPADLLAKYEQNSYIKSKEDASAGQAKRLLKQYYIALNMGDQERMDEIEDKLFAIGDKHPDLGITQDTINRSVRSRDAISRDMYQGVQINKRIRDDLISASEDIFGR